MEPLDVYRIIGAIAGSGVALLVLRANGRREFVARLLVATVSGFIGAPALRYWWSWPDFPRLALTASFICAVASWFVLEAWIRIPKSKIVEKLLPK